MVFAGTNHWALKMRCLRRLCLDDSLIHWFFSVTKLHFEENKEIRRLPTTILDGLCQLSDLLLTPPPPHTHTHARTHGWMNIIWTISHVFLYALLRLRGTFEFYYPRLICTTNVFLFVCFGGGGGKCPYIGVRVTWALSLKDWKVERLWAKVKWVLSSSTISVVMCRLRLWHLEPISYLSAHGLCTGERVFSSCAFWNYSERLIFIKMYMTSRIRYWIIQAYMHYPCCNCGLPHYGYISCV